YEEINEEIVKRFGLLFNAGEIDPGDEVGESIVDSSEIINTLGGGGVSTVGYAAEAIENKHRGGLLSRFTGPTTEETIDTATTTNRITSLVRKAVLGRLTLPCELQGIERALVVISGPPEHLNRKGIEYGRKWTEEQTGSMEVRGGDYPIRRAEQVACTVLLSGVTNVPRIKELQQVAIEAQHNIEDIKDASRANLEELVTAEDDELEPLF
ncbi:MAG: cell division protein, partial [Halobacteriota archaeon]